MLVTDIKESSKKKGKFDVYVEGKLAFSLIAADIEYFKIKKGENLPDNKYNFIMENIVYIKTQDLALSYISGKMRTEKEVCGKLRLNGFDEDIVKKVLDFLKKYDYVNDYNYCLAFIRQSLKLNPMGYFAIRQKLKIAGVEDYNIEKAWNESNVDQLKYAEFITDKKLKGKKIADEKEMRKLQDFLLRKGYSYDIIKDIIKNHKLDEK